MGYYVVFKGALQKSHHCYVRWTRVMLDVKFDLMSDFNSDVMSDVMSNVMSDATRVSIF